LRIPRDTPACQVTFRDAPPLAFVEVVGKAGPFRSNFFCAFMLKWAVCRLY
jgi:hypothetical protein